MALLSLARTPYPVGHGTLSARSTGAHQPMSDADLAAVARIAEIGGTGFEHRPALAKLDRPVPLP